jgi:hypothetical protein
MNTNLIFLLYALTKGTQVSFRLVGPKKCIVESKKWQFRNAGWKQLGCVTTGTQNRKSLPRRRQARQLFRWNVIILAIFRVLLWRACTIWSVYFVINVVFRLYFLKRKQYLIEQRYFTCIVIETTLSPAAFDKQIRKLAKPRLKALEAL